MNGLSTRQQGILTFIGKFRMEHGYPPTIREIGAALTISSTSVVNYNLNILEQRGYIARDKTVSRGINLMGDEDERQFISAPGVFDIPVLGAIAAGEPIPIPQEGFSPVGYESIALTRDIVRNPEGIFALRVRGDSMIDALINDGDLVVMRHQPYVDNGEMAAVWLTEENETTLKRFYLEDGRVMLQPANPAYKTRVFPADSVQVQGKVIAVIRQVD
ncbi:MAG: repressor LexA [Chloroflexi bacterium RBG_16_57_9]|nr:MAG: repressor LexA [Chloroflexi bacterium RBG_16_57_9]